MKIAMLGHKRVPSRDGGVEVVVGELASRMATLGHEVIVYNRREKGNSTVSEEFLSGVTIKSVPTINKKGLAALSSSFFAALSAMRDRPDVIHFHAEGPCAMIPIVKAAGIRSVATIHGLDWQRAKWGRFASWYLKLGEKTAAKHADDLIVLSRAMQGYFRDEYNRETRFVPNGIESKKRKDANVISEKYGLSEGSYVLFLGRIVPEKGVHYLVKAFKHLDTEKRLVIAGGPSDSEGYFNEVRDLASDDDRVIFTGFVQGLELEELYSNAYLYVLPSDVEGMPMSLLEAMAYGRCCLTSDIPECAEVLDGAGATFVAGNTEALKDELHRLLNDPAKVSVLASASLKRASAYSWDAVVAETLGLYGSATGDKTFQPERIMG